MGMGFFRLGIVTEKFRNLVWKSLINENALKIYLQTNKLNKTSNSDMTKHDLKEKNSNMSLFYLLIFTKFFIVTPRNGAGR